MTASSGGLPGTGDPGSVFRFTVTVDGVYYAAFSEFTLPSLDVETLDITEGGQNAYVHKLPVRVKVGSAKLRHGVADSLDLLHWYIQVMQGDIEGSKREVSIVLYNNDSTPMITWSFRNAYPVRWSGPTFNAQENSVAFEEIEFVHHGFDVETSGWSYLGESGSSA
jgi:phage tail-like protein